VQEAVGSNPAVPTFRINSLRALTRCPFCFGDIFGDIFDSISRFFLIVPCFHQIKSVIRYYAVRWLRQQSDVELAWPAYYSLFHLLDQKVWRKDWVVHSQPVGTGSAAFKYLAPYIFRVAISNRRILALEDGQVTFSYKDSATDQTRFSTIPAEEFIRRFLQHVLPKGFVKVRYYGLLAASNRHLLDQARQLLTTAASNSNSSDSDCQRKDTGEPPCCHKCGAALRLVESLQPKTRWPP